MANSPAIDCTVSDPITSSDLTAFSSSRSRIRDIDHNHRDMRGNHRDTAPGERDPLLSSSAQQRKRKPFYRPRPLWIVPFAIIASLTRAMTVAPRVEVFTQLSCNSLHGQWNHTTVSISAFTQHSSMLHDPSPSIHFSPDPAGPSLYPLPCNSSTACLVKSTTDDDDPRELPSNQCISDPAVQAGAARLQTIMTTTMGTLSALTTGWWGHFGERHGRMAVLAIATLGLFLTDLTFILVSTPHTIFASHGHKFLIIAPFIEGALGGWSTLQAATAAYISDCTSDGSRAHIFSRVTGVFYLGFAVGPTVGAWLIRNPIIPWHPVGHTPPSVTSVFWAANFCSFLNLLLVIFIFPESLPKEKRIANKDTKGKGRASDEMQDHDIPRGKGDKGTILSVLSGFLSPFAAFAPKYVDIPGSSGQRKRDWSLTFLALALFGYTLSMGVYQLKYLFAEHVYGWGAEKLSYYISFISCARALYLLFVLPFIIAHFKPKPLPGTKSKSKLAHSESHSTVPSAPSHKSKKPKPTRASLAREMQFDLVLTRVSFLIDIISNSLMTLSPISADTHAQALFVCFTTLSSLGTGVIPAVQSLAICITQARGLAVSDGAHASDNEENGGVGRLLGALAVLQAVGQMIFGPMLFGLVYSGTVGTFPKTIFATAASILVVSLAMLLMVRPLSTGPAAIQKRRKLRRESEPEIERGRSRISKDLSGGSPRQAQPGPSDAVVSPIHE